VEFALEKVRIGHVSIRWEEHRQQRLWKLIMGSNQIAREFQELFAHVLAAVEREAEACKTPIGKEYRISRVQSPAVVQKDTYSPNVEDKIRKSPSKLEKQAWEGEQTGLTMANS
jgi:hypothetical protein